MRRASASRRGEGPVILRADLGELAEHLGAPARQLAASIHQEGEDIALDFPEVCRLRQDQQWNIPLIGGGDRRWRGFDRGDDCARLMFAGPTNGSFIDSAAVTIVAIHEQEFMG